MGILYWLIYNNWRFKRFFVFMIYSLFLKEFNLLDEFLIRVESFWFRVFIVG